MRAFAAKRLEELLPEGAIQDLVALIEENKRRAARGRPVMPRCYLAIEFDEKTGDVEVFHMPKEIRRAKRTP